MWYDMAMERLKAEKQLAEYEDILYDIKNLDDSIEKKKKLVDSLNKKIALKKEEIFIYRKAEEQFS